MPRFLLLAFLSAILLTVSEVLSEENAPTHNTTSTSLDPIEVTLFHNIRFQGSRQTYNLFPGQCIGLALSMSKEASSFNGTCAILFDRPGCAGKEKKIEGQVATMPFGWNNEVQSIGSCVGPVQKHNYKNILTLYEHAEFRGRSHILQPSPDPGICIDIQGYQDWASSVKVTGCLRVWTRQNCTGKYLDISEDREDLATDGYSDVIKSFELCSNELRSYKRVDKSMEVTLYSDTNRRGEQSFYYLNPGQCINFTGFGLWGRDYPKSIDVECAYLYYEKDCKGKRIKVIGSNLNLAEEFIGADSVQSCEPGSSPSNKSYVMLIRNDGLKSPVHYFLEPTQCTNLMFEFEKADLLSYDADCAILFDDRWCQGNQLEIKGINSIPSNWKYKAASVGSCVGPMKPRPAHITAVTIKHYKKSYTVEIPRGPCVSMTQGRHWGRVDADAVSTDGCVYWYNEASDCINLRRKVNGTKLVSTDFEKGVRTWSNPYVGSLQTCNEYTSGPSYLAIYEFPQLNIGYNSFVGFKLEPKSCIDLWGAREKWAASIDADCAVIFEGHWCTEEQKKIVGAVKILGNWKHRISSIGSCDGPIPSGRQNNTSLITLYSAVGLEGIKRLYEAKPGECITFSRYDMDPLSASSDGCIQLYDLNWNCGGDFKRLDGNIEDLMDWSKDENKFYAYVPKSARRCEDTVPVAS